MDQPEISLKMMSIFMSKGSFAANIQGIDGLSTEPTPPCPICPECQDFCDETCIRCSEASHSIEPTCSEQAEKAKQKAIAMAKNQRKNQKSSFVWAVPFVCLIGVLAFVISLRKRTENRATGYSNPNTELPEQERYSDEPDDDDTGIPHGNGESQDWIILHKQVCYILYWVYEARITIGEMFSITSLHYFAPWKIYRLFGRSLWRHKISALIFCGVCGSDIQRWLCGNTQTEIIADSCLDVRGIHLIKPSLATALFAS